MPINQALSLVGGVVDFRNSPVQAAAGQIVAWGNQGRQSGNTYKMPNGQLITPPHNYRGRCITCHPQLCKNIVPAPAQGFPLGPQGQGLNPFGTAQNPALALTPAAMAQNIAMVKSDVPFIGLSVIDVDWVITEHFDLLHPSGVIVERVYDRTPAAEAGVLRSDIIMRLNGRKINSALEFKKIINTIEIGKTVELLIYRNGQRKIVTLKTIPFPPFDPQTAQTPTGRFTWLESEIADIDSTLKPYIKNGVYVIDVDGILARSGVMPNDIITAVNGTTVTDMASFIETAKTANVWSGINLEILRNGNKLSINVNKNVNSPVTPAAYTPNAQAVANPLTIPAPPSLNKIKEFDWQGTEISPINPSIAPFIQNGVMVTEPGGILRRSGVMPNDIIIAINGETVYDIGTFMTITNNLDLNKGALLDIVRSGQEVYVTVKRGNAFKLLAGTTTTPPPQAAAAPNVNPQTATPPPAEFDWQGTEVSPITQALAAYIPNGVFVTEPSGVLKRSGLQKGDVITAINNNQITDITSFIAIAKQVDVKSSPLLEIIRSGNPMQLQVK
ncbi:conserved magnetosome protein with 3 PDZ domain and [Candidatus Magnetoovum chiemensis]|nr:conserved magnetosome protein with 3 PDZ domain and [Candidatus Magnetoovum chiemensis]